MNLELYYKMKSLKKDIKVQDDELRAKFEAVKNTATYEEKLEMKKQDDLYKANHKEVSKDIKAYEELGTAAELDESKVPELKAFEEMLINKYGLEIKKEEKPVEVVKVKKAKRKTTAIIASALAAAIVFGSGFLAGLVKCKNCGKNAEETRTQVEQTVEAPVVSPEVAQVIVETPVPTPEATPVPTPEATPVEAAIEEVVAELPFEEYGNFTDVNNEEQLRNRATWYYNTFIADPNKPSHAGSNSFTIEQIMNDMRMINGEFMVNADGSARYNDTDMINVANDLHTVANYDSFKQYGTQIYFTPMAPLFTDGSLAQQGALDLDKAMERVVAAIRAENDEEFLAAAKEWGTIVINMFNYVDYTGEYVNIYQVEYPTSFALYHAMSAKYASTILEYSEAHHLNVCIDYCTDYETGEVKQEALSEIMYRINEIPQDAVAVRSGHQAEYEQNNLSLPEILFVGAKDYFNSKYDLEIGCSRTLK